MRRELLITGANMTDEEWSAFCEQRQRKIDDRHQSPTEGGIGSTDEVEMRKEQYKIVIITRDYSYYINLSILTINTVLENH